MIDIKKLEQKVYDLIESETPESLTKWIIEHRKRNIKMAKDNLSISRQELTRYHEYACTIHGRMKTLLVRVDLDNNSLLAENISRAKDEAEQIEWDLGYKLYPDKYKRS